MTMSAYGKFSDTLREIEAQGAAAPKPPEPPKDAVSTVDAGRTLDALGALGGAEPETRSLSAADSTRQSVAEGHSREAKGDFGDRAHDRPNHLKPQPSWGAAEEERAAIVEYEAGIPRAWAEGFARLRPERPLADVSPKRWQQFIDDIGRFLDAGWAEKASALGWGPLDLFGCDRERPFARLDHAGLLWLLNGDRLAELDCHRAVVERSTGSRQVFRRRPLAVGEVVLAWELVV
jgi:hypothetical protein